MIILSVLWLQKWVVYSSIQACLHLKPFYLKLEIVLSITNLQLFPNKSLKWWSWSKLRDLYFKFHKSTISSITFVTLRSPVHGCLHLTLKHKHSHIQPFFLHMYVHYYVVICQEMPYYCITLSILPLFPKPTWFLFTKEVNQNGASKFMPCFLTTQRKWWLHKVKKITRPSLLPPPP